MIGANIWHHSGALYADVVLNETICDLYTSHTGKYGQQVTSISPIIVTGSTDQGMYFIFSESRNEIDDVLTTITQS